MAAELDFHVYRPDRPGIRKVLGDLEAEVMEQIWERAAGLGTTVRDVFEVLYERRLAPAPEERRRIAYTTVMNTMARLAKKRLLRVEKVDQAYVYYPTLTQEEFVSQIVGQILEDLLVSFSGTTIAGLAKLRNQQAAERARQLLDEIERRRSTEEET